jgi:nucleoside 2-deoxyribosyltransferase
MPALIVDRPRDGGFEFECLRCGLFRISADADAKLRQNMLNQQVIGTVSGYIRKNSGLRIDEPGLTKLTNIVAPSVSEKTQEILLQLAKECPTPGVQINDPAVIVAVGARYLKEFEGKNVFPSNVSKLPGVASMWWLAVASASSASELRWLIHEALKTSGYLEDGEHFIFNNHGYKSLKITPIGWEAVERMQQRRSDSRIGFVAMSFRPEFNDLYDKGISEAIRLAGYESLRIDRAEHNNRIDDEIIASIKRSRFLVADFTALRGGIYFEAGYALALGLPVVWLVRSDQLDEVHFDTRQYNFIQWDNGEWAALQRALKNRIEATVGTGPGVG